VKNRYVFVDESGQDTQGRYFIIAIVIPQDDPFELENICKTIELKSRKRELKWRRSGRAEKENYFRCLLEEPKLRSILFNRVVYGRRDFVDQTIEATAQAILKGVSPDQRVIVFFDGFDSKKERQVLGAGLRRRGIAVDKVRGFRKEENHSLLRLADALAGLTRDAIEGEASAHSLYRRLIQEGCLHEIGA
jgi:hypothetical protein